MGLMVSGVLSSSIMWKPSSIFSKPCSVWVIRRVGSRRPALIRAMSFSRRYPAAGAQPAGEGNVIYKATGISHSDVIRLGEVVSGNVRYAATALHHAVSVIHSVLSPTAENNFIHLLISGELHDLLYYIASLVVDKISGAILFGKLHCQRSMTYSY